MFEKKINLFVLFFISLLVYSCIDDDVCDEVSTPRMTIVLDSLGNRYTKERLYIDRKNSDGTIFNEGIFLDMDSIKIPLNALSNETVYYIYDSVNTADSDKNIITVKYQTAQEFVSKACGFKIIYKDVSYQLTQGVSIKSITSNTTEIHDESSTNLFISY